MKDKRTYTHLKEHGEDMTHENESKVDPKEDRGPGDLSLLVELHKKEIWDWKQKPNTPNCLLYTSPSPRDRTRSRMPSSA